MCSQIDKEQKITSKTIHAKYEELVALIDSVKNGSIDKETAKGKLKEYNELIKRVDKHIKEEIAKIKDKKKG